MDTVSDSLNKWVHKQINAYGWSMRELGRRSGLSPSYISDVLAGKQEPGAKFYQGVAGAFDLTIESIEQLDREGVLPKNRAIEQDYQDLMEMAKKLSPDDLKDVLDYTIYRLRRSKNKPL